MMKRLRSWFTGATPKSAKASDLALSETETKLARQLMEFDRTNRELRRAAEEVDRRLSGQHR